MTRPSLLCVTHSRKKRNCPVGLSVRQEKMNYKVIPVGIDGTRSVQGNIGWYLVVLGHNKSVLLGT